MAKFAVEKSYYSKSIKDSLNAVIISPDEATYELIYMIYITDKNNIKIESKNI